MLDGNSTFSQNHVPHATIQPMFYSTLSKGIWYLLLRLFVFA